MTLRDDALTAAEDEKACVRNHVRSAFLDIFGVEPERVDLYYPHTHLRLDLGNTLLDASVREDGIDFVINTNYGSGPPHFYALSAKPGNFFRVESLAALGKLVRDGKV